MSEQEFLKKFKEAYKGKVISYEEMKKQKSYERTRETRETKKLVNGKPI